LNIKEYPIRLFIQILSFALAAYCSAETNIKQEKTNTEKNSKIEFKLVTPVTNGVGKVIDIEELRRKFNDLDAFVKQEDPAHITIFPKFTPDITPYIVEACGHQEEFEKFFKSHGWQQKRLLPFERAFLESCLSNVYQFAEAQFDFIAPGYFKRFSARHVTDAIDLGYKCGYRTGELFALFSLNVWFFGLDEVSNFPKYNRLNCLGDITSRYKYTRKTHSGNVKRNINRFIGRYLAFGNWADVQKYMAYKNIQHEHFRDDACKTFLDPIYHTIPRAIIDSFEEYDCMAYFERYPFPYDTRPDVKKEGNNVR